MSDTLPNRQPAEPAFNYDESALAALIQAASRINDSYLHEQILRISQRIQHEMREKSRHETERNHELARSFDEYRKNPT